MRYDVETNTDENVIAICVSCQFGYVIQGKKCVRKAEADQSSNKNYIPPVFVEDGPVLKQEDIKGKNGT